MNNVGKSIRLIRKFYPESREADLTDRLKQYEAIVAKNKENAALGKNQDYSQGYNVGEWLAAQGEDLDLKDIDQIGNELLEDFDWSQLPVNSAEYFKDGILNGYTLTQDGTDEEE
jgi:hypothetical protein